MKLILNENMDDIELTKAYNEALIAVAKENPNVVDVEADVANCIFGPNFQKEFPERYIDLGICEQSLSSVSAGMSAVGMVPFCHTFAVFASRRMCDQNYISCAYAKNNVKIVASAPGISSGENGGTHHANEDIALVRPITDITIMEPADSAAMRWAVKNAAENFGVYYIRAERYGQKRIYADDAEFKIGQANVVREGNDVTLIAEGNLMLDASLKAADLLAAEGISARVVDIFTIKPIDVDTIVKCANETGAIVTVENHSITGGLGSAVAEVLVDQFCAVPMKRIGVPNRFGEVGQIPDLQKVMHMTPEDIAAAAKTVIGGKK
ncbi:MAG: transketolase family protein [Lachnospiraceae bacterium]|jgi:transketolase|nr:transketolase family protein [Lachnospiraceae bacterium]